MRPRGLNGLCDGGDVRKGPAGELEVADEGREGRVGLWVEKEAWGRRTVNE